MCHSVHSLHVVFHPLKFMPAAGATFGYTFKSGSICPVSACSPTGPPVVARRSLLLLTTSGVGCSPAHTQEGSPSAVWWRDQSNNQVMRITRVYFVCAYLHCSPRKNTSLYQQGGTHTVPNYIRTNIRPTSRSPSHRRLCVFTCLLSLQQ